MGKGRPMYTIEAKTILTPQNGLNIYRGSTDHCLVSPVYARTARVENPEELGVKPDADRLLEVTLRKKRSRGMVSVGSLSDPYNAVEKSLGIMRRCLFVLDRCDFGVSIQTRYSLLLRDLDILQEINRKTKVVVTVPLPTLQMDAFRLIEGELGLSERLQLLEGLEKAGITTILLVDPIIPGVNDTITSLGMVLQLARDHHMCYLEHRDMKTQLQNGSREHFYRLLRGRDSALALKLITNYGDKENELVPENQKELLRYLVDRTKEASIICDKKEIQDFRRRYENHTEGRQLEIEDLL